MNPKYSQGLRNLKDCPGCKFGTLDMEKRPDKDGDYWWVCADCGKRFKVEEKKP